MTYVSNRKRNTSRSERSFAVPAFNAGSGQLLNAVIEACEEAESPVMIAIHPEELKFLADGFIAQVKYTFEQTNIPRMYPFR